jgi:hypothetical protein
MRRTLGILAATLMVAVSGLGLAGGSAAAGQGPVGDPEPTARRGAGGDTDAVGSDDSGGGDEQEGLHPLGIAAFVVAGIVVVVFRVWWRPSDVPGMPGTWGRAHWGDSSSARRSSSRGRRRYRR